MYLLLQDSSWLPVLACYCKANFPSLPLCLNNFCDVSAVLSASEMPVSPRPAVLYSQPRDRLSLAVGTFPSTSHCPVLQGSATLCYIFKSAHFLVFPNHANFSHLQTAFLRNDYWKDVNIPWISGQYCLRCYLSSAEAESFLGHGAITVLPG